MRLQSPPRFIVLTGASTGIGAACALACVSHGMTVFAGVRSREAGEALRRQGGERLIPVHLDVTDPESIRQAERVVRGTVGLTGLSGLVNNAGIAVGSPLEVVPIDALRRQLDVNVIGQIMVTQAFLPLLRLARGRIVNMGSIAGRGTIPVMGPYSASKHALEALTDALRLELQPWGIRVAIIEPGAIATPIWEKSTKTGDEIAVSVGPAAMALYGDLVARVKDTVAQAARRAISPDVVAQTVLHALTASKPKTRYLVGLDAKIRSLMLKWLPDRAQDWMLTKVLTLPAWNSK
ncbi:MAG: SDR family oxidoreductase [Nitrospira sp.]|nr:SDR family oxidoreductase [Nitrospira sp.]